VFRRRRSADVDRVRPGGPEEGNQQPYGDDDLGHDEPFHDEPPEFRREDGPWDAEEPYPARERVDLGCLLIPVGSEWDIEFVMSDQQGAWIAVKREESEMQLQAFAAARRDELWNDVRAEIAGEVRAVDGESEEAAGPFGIELNVRLPGEPAPPVKEWAAKLRKEAGGGSLLARFVGVNGPGSFLVKVDGEEEVGGGLQPVRFVGVDGPRWFIRALFTGPAAAGGEPASTLEEIFRDVVVVRGDYPMPPRDLLELRLPPEAQQALEEEAERSVTS
jgi:hypothetical protein